MQEKANFRPAIIPLGFALIIVGRAHGGGKDARYNWFYFSLIASICLYEIIFTTTERHTGGQGHGTVICTIIFTASEHMLLRNREPEIRQLGQTRPMPAMSLWERLKVNTSLILSPRHIGFSSQITSPHIRSTPPNITRRQFITSRLQWLCFYGLLFSFTNTVCRSFPMYAQGDLRLSFSECGWIWRTTIWLQIFGISGMMSIIYTSASIVVVALGINSPQAWPPYFGSLKDAYTVRNAWGRVWHQLLRKVCGSIFHASMSV